MRSLPRTPKSPTNQSVSLTPAHLLRSGWSGLAVPRQPTIIIGMRSSRWPLAASVFLLLLLPCTVPADGAAWKSGASWPRISERDQFAIIAHADGRERMALAVRLDMLAGESGVWLVPVRGTSDTVRIDLAEDLPWTSGGIAHPDRAAGSRILDSAIAVAAIASPGQPLSYVLAGIAIPNLMESRVGQYRGAEVQRDGLTATVLPARSQADLAGLLAGLGRPVPTEALAGFAPYCDGRHSVVAVRLDEVARDHWAGRVPALLLDFPSAAPWFPMRASAGGGTTRVHLQLAGWWQSDDATSIPVSGAIWQARRQTGASQAWLGLPDAAWQRTTRHNLRGEPSDFATDLDFSPDQRPALERGLALLSIPAWAWLIGLAILAAAAGAVGGAIASSLLLRQRGWGARRGVFFVCGGFLLIWLIVRRECGRMARPSGGIPDGPLDLVPMLATAVLVLPACIIGLYLGNLWSPLPALAVVTALHGSLWIAWGLRDPLGRRSRNRLAAAIRRRGAWAYAAPSFSAALVALALMLPTWWIHA